MPTMPGTTRYSATFDRPYEEENRNQPPGSSNGSRRSRSQSWQARGPLNIVRPYASTEDLRTPLFQRSSSTDGQAARGAECIPTRTSTKPPVKAHNNPFQFVKVGAAPLYKKAEEQLKKAKEVKKPDVLKEEEEEWQSNLDSWKSRRRKMSEDVFRRQEEIRQFEMEEQNNVQNIQKKTKTFSEMVESRATRGRALSLSLIASPLDLQKWEQESNTHSNSSNPFSEESEGNSAVNSEDEGVGVKQLPLKNHNSSNGVRHPSKSLVARTRSNKSNRLFEPGQNGLQYRDGVYADSGLESISSSHRAGDTPDSCSDFSQDSGSSIDFDSPRASGLLTDVNILEQFGDMSAQKVGSHNGITFENSSGAEMLQRVFQSSSMEDKDITDADFNGCSASSGESYSPPSSSHEDSLSPLSSKQERSIESENEVFVDDFESQSRNSDLASSSSLNKGNEESVPDTNGDQISFIKCNATLSVKSDLPSVDNSHSQDVPKEIPENDIPTVKIKISKKKRLSSAGAISNSQKNSLCEIARESLGDPTLNVVFQSPPAKSNTNSRQSSCSTGAESVLTLKDVKPVEKVAEEMERLILEQLEKEERAKELSFKVQSPNVFGSPDHSLTAPSRLAEPPREKPPPPPPDTEDEIPKCNSLKRIDSTKRIKKEIYKRRSNFLGIDSTDESSLCDEPLMRPPLALEQILKAEMELNRENMKKLELAAAERLKLNEKEMVKKEQEILESLELEECQKLFIPPNISELACEEDRIRALKEERQRIERERALNEEQRLRLEEEQRLKEREECVRQQEDDIASHEPLLSDIPIAANSPNASLSVTPSNSHSGGGAEMVLNSSQTADTPEKPVVKPEKPAVPPKPFKKKETIRKERERLRQEQEELQRERESHRRKLQEQEDLLKLQQNTHVDAPLPNHLPPIVKPSPPLTAAAQLGVEAKLHTQNKVSPRDKSPGEKVTLIGIRQKKPSPPRRKPVENENWSQPKTQPIKKQPSPDSTREAKRSLNPNHWLIQEAEMRRIADLKERQRRLNPQAYPPDEGPSRPIVGNAPDKVWLYGPCNPPIKKYPPPAVHEKPVAAYPRDLLPPSKPSRALAMEGPEQMLSVSGRKRCSHCSEELGRGAAMIIESLQLYYHIQCFQCCVCQSQLGNGSCGTDVRVRNNKLHCHNCYSNDEAGLKFSQV